MAFDPLVLARIQFAANISFHILFPAISIGLAWILLFFRLQYTRTQDAKWNAAYLFWVKIFALTFALGVVSGITMSFQFGTNWPGFMDRVGNVAGPLLGYEVLTAFFLEASFLGLMLFGRDRISNRLHLISCFLVAIGTTTSAFWILSLNSWMHTPAGFVMQDGVVMIDRWIDVIFNPSFPYRFCHMLIASLLTSAFVMAGISAWQVRSNVASPATWCALKTGVLMAAVLSPLQAFVGDLHGLNTLQHQPAKIAAMEGLWHTEKGAELTLFGWPDEDAGTTHFKVAIPKMASLILAHDMDAELKGLDAFEGEHPPVLPVFWAFRIMVATGLLMIAVSWMSAWQVMRGRVHEHSVPPFMILALSWMTFSGWLAVLAGWYVTEIGRQPYVVYGLIRTSEVVADHGAGMVLTSLIAYLLLYAFLLASYVFTLRYMATKKSEAVHAPQQSHFDTQMAEKGGPAKS